MQLFLNSSELLTISYSHKGFISNGSRVMALTDRQTDRHTHTHTHTHKQTLLK